MKMFHDKLKHILDHLNKAEEIYYVIGNTNVDFLKCDKLRLTKKHVDMIHS